MNGAEATRAQHWLVDPGFDLEAFLARPLVARVATAGPTVRPVWYLWEEEAFWWLTGRWSRLETILSQDPEVAVVVDTCDLDSGEVLQVVARGSAEVLPLDERRARRKLARYLGPDEASWDRRFVAGTFADPSVRLVRSLRARCAPATCRSARPLGRSLTSVRSLIMRSVGGALRRSRRACV